jgi:CubicO group peptidase (beta-lactamase class C family)
MPHKTAATFASELAISGWLVSSGLVQTKGFSEFQKSALSNQISKSVDRGDSPGVVTLIVGRDGVLYQGAAGKLDVARNVTMPVNAIFSIASMTKPVTSLAAF